MINNIIIVIGGDHYNTLWTIRSLGLAGINSYLIIVSDDQTSFVSKSKYVKQSFVVESEVNILDTLKNNFSLESIKPLIISTSDSVADVLDQNYSWLSKSFMLPNVKFEEGGISNWMDKKLMNDAAAEAGFNIPKTWSVNLFQNTECTPPSDIIYPCLIKPLKSSIGSKKDFRICNNESSLKKEMQYFKVQNAEIVIQEYLKPDFEISILGVNLPNSKRNIIPGLLYKIGTCKYLHNLGMPTFACVKSEIEPYIQKKTVDCFLSKINYSGIYSIEFFVSNNKPYFLEINLRTDGDMFVYTAAGVNLPLLWVLDTIGHDISTLKQKVTTTTYGMTEVSYIKHLRYYKFSQIIKDFYRSDCFSIFSIKDVKPFIYKFLYSLK